MRGNLVRHAGLGGVRSTWRRGPWRASPWAAVLLATTAVAGCASRGAGPGAPPSARTEQTLTQLFDLRSVYERLGRLAASGQIPFIGNVAYVAGRGDSTLALIGFSFENRSLSFQRDAGTFAARYDVEIELVREGRSPIQVTRREIVRVPTFEETQRTDETIFFQQSFLLAPGTYQLRVNVRDPGSGGIGRVERAVEVPAYGPSSMSAPVMVYEVLPRRAVTDSFYSILNPRGTVANGGADTLLLYVEGYSFPGPTTWPVEVRDERDSVVIRDEVSFAGGRPVEARVIRLAADVPPLGELQIVVGSGSSARSTRALVSFARGWVVTNYDNLLSLLRFFPYRPDLLGQLRNAAPADRAALWRRFWEATDPIPETPANEALDEYFTRVAIANERFREEGGEGWRTDRGEVFITLGNPDQIYESPPSVDRRYERWFYSQYQAVLDFEGTLGFSRLRLTPQSRAEFSRARAQLLRSRTNR